MRRVAAPKKDRRLALVLAAYLLLAGLNSVVVPPFEKPDEIWHYAFIQHLATGGGLPVQEPNTEARWRQEGGQAPGYYLAAAALTAWVDQRDFPAIYAQSNPHAAIGLPGTLANVNFQVHPPGGWRWQGAILALHLARGFSVALGLITLCALHATLRRLAGPERALLGVALWAFIPQFIFVSSSASNDIAITAAATLLGWRLVALLQEAPATPAASDPHGLRRPWQKPRPFLAIGLLLGLALLSKLSALALVPITALTLALAGWRARSWRIVAQGGLLVAAVALALAGWWFARNGALYGDPLAINVWQENVEARQPPQGWRALLLEWQGLDFSFWGLFGWFNLPYPTWLYRAFEGVEAVAAVGLVVQATRWARRVALRWDWRWLASGVLALWLLALFLSWLSFSRVTYASQGRLFFPAASAIALGLTVGLSAWRGPGGRPWLAWGVVAALLALNLVTPWWLVRPAYQPAPTLAALPPDAELYSVRFGDSVQLEGYRIAPAPLVAGEAVDVTLFWRGRDAIQRPLSVTVKLYDSSETILAQTDSYPDGGRRATQFWQTAQLVEDRHRLRLPPNIATPQTMSIVADIYLLDPARDEVAQNLLAFAGGTLVPSPVQLTKIAARPPAAEPAPAASWAFRPQVERVELAGGEARLRFAWEVGQPLAKSYQAFFHLAPAPDQLPVAQNDFEPLRGTFLTEHWWPGDHLPDEATLRLPTDGAPGSYVLLLGLYDLATAQRVAGEGGRTAWVVGRLRWDGTEWYGQSE